MQDRARVVVIGGGIHGAALLFHLTLEGWSDVLLVEKAELTNGSTWHAAGQITRSVGDCTSAAFANDAIEPDETLAERVDRPISFHQPGGLRLASTDLELDALEAQLGIGRDIGYPIELIGPDEAARLNPFHGPHRRQGRHLDRRRHSRRPDDATMAFIAGARANGADMVRHSRVIEVNHLPNGEWSVVTEKGTVTAEHVVDAAGCHAHQVAELSGLTVPQANGLHHDLVTEEVPELAARPCWVTPVMRDNRVAGDIRQEQTAGLIGIYEQRSPAPGVRNRFASVHAANADAGTKLDALILGERRRAAVPDGPVWDRENTELLG